MIFLKTILLIFSKMLIRNKDLHYKKTKEKVFQSFSLLGIKKIVLQDKIITRNAKIYLLLKFAKTN